MSEAYTDRESNKKENEDTIKKMTDYQNKASDKLTQCRNYNLPPTQQGTNNL